MELLEKLFAILLAAGSGEAIIEFIFSPPIKLMLRRVCKNFDEEATQLASDTVFHSLSALLGVGIAINFELGFFGAFGYAGRIEHVDMILTGALIGRGSNWVHEFTKKFLEERAVVEVELTPYRG